EVESRDDRHGPGPVDHGDQPDRLATREATRDRSRRCSDRVRLGVFGMAEERVIMSRVVVDRGRLVQFRTIPDPHSFMGPDYDTWLEYQAYELDGTPAKGSYRGEGAVVDGMLILGDPYTKATLTEYRVDREPTPDSNDRFEG